MVRARTVVPLALVAIGLMSAFVATQPTDIRTIACPGAASTVIAGINDAGRAVAVYFDSLPIVLGGFHGFVWDGSGCAQRIPGLPDDTIPTGVNDAGDVVGIYIVPALGQARGFLYRRGRVQDLLCPAAEPKPCVAWPWGINNRGQVVGYFDRQGPDRPFVWEDGSYVALAELPWGHITVRAHSINPRGDVAGEFYSGPGSPPHLTYGYYWPTGGVPSWFGFPVETNTPQVAKTTVPQGITPRGDVVGYFYESLYDDDPSLEGVLIGPSRGFFRDRDGAIVELKVPGATYTCPMGINAAGEVSGAYTTDPSTTPLAGISWRGFVAKVEALVVR
jgi:probable HAF family extracellular repeat protein